MKKHQWFRAWLAQILIMLLSGAVVALCDLLGGLVHGILSWGVMPALGLLTACRATRKGLNNYLAWVAPPVCMAAPHWLIWTYPPNPGPVVLCAFVSLVGAAAGEVLNQRERKG